MANREWREEDSYWLRDNLLFRQLDRPEDASPAPDLWRDLPRNLLHARRHFPRLSSITIQGNMHTAFPENLLPTVFSKDAFPRLTMLHLTHMSRDAGIDDNFIAAIGGACPGLRSFSLQYCMLLTDAGLEALAVSCKHLTHVSLRLCSNGITDVGMEALLSRTCHLEELLIARAARIQGWGFRAGHSLTFIHAENCLFDDRGLREGFMGLHALTRLHMPCIFKPAATSLFSWAFITEYSCRNLVELVLEDAPDMGNRAIQQIVKRCPQLRVLNLCGCDEIDLPGWQAIAKYALHLEELDARYCDGLCDMSLLIIAHGCPSLRLFKLCDQAFGEFVVRRPTVQVQLYRVDDDSGDCVLIQ